MPWNNQGGGGWRGGNNGGPWGQGPSGGGGSGPRQQPPDLEEIIKKGQDRLRSVLPSGGGNNRLIALLIVIALGAFWAWNSIYTIQPSELGVELLFGKPKEEISEPGLHAIIWPFETVERAGIDERQLNIGISRRGTANQGLMLSGDQNIVDVQFSVLYQVSNPAQYLFNVANPDDMVRQVAESAMREVVGRRPAQDIYRDDREGISVEVRDIMQNTLQSYGAGLQVNDVSIEDAAPPREVSDAFDEVQRAEQDEDRFVEEANQYSNQQLGQARGEAAQIREDAAAYKRRVVEEATGEAQRFISVFEEYAKAPEVTRKRLFLETMEEVLNKSNKVIIEQTGGSGVVPYLPLPEINKRATQGAN